MPKLVAAPPRLVPLVSLRASLDKNTEPDARDNSSEVRVLRKSGRQDLNLRPLGPETPRVCSHRFRWALRICNCPQMLREARHSLRTQSQKLHRIRDLLLLGCYDELPA